MSVHTVQLSEVCAINPATSLDLREDSLCAFVPMEAVDDWSAQITRLTARPFREVAKGYTTFNENDVLLAKITPCMENGKCAIARGLRDRAGFGTTEFHVLRASQQVLPEWLFYFWRMPQTRQTAERFMTGSAGQKRVPSDYLESLVIPLPELPEQKRLAALLERADRLRRTRCYALELSDTLLSAAFIALFGDPLKNPRGYPIRELGDLLLIPPGLGTTKPCQSSGSLRCVRVGEVGSVEIDIASCGFVNLTESERRRFVVETNDILLARAIGSEDHLGKLSICQPHTEVLTFDSHLMRVRTDSSQLVPVFLASLLWSSGGRRLFMRQARRTAVQFNINAEQMSELALPIPPLEEQQHFAALVAQHERLRTNQREALRQAEHQFQSLLHRAFSGELATVAEVIELQSSPEFIRAVLAAEVADRMRDDRFFGQTKLQKIIYLAEHICKLAEIDSRHARYTRGPHDPELIEQVERKMRACEWYETIPRSGDSYGHQYHPLAQAGGHRRHFEKLWPKQAAAIRRLIDEMKSWKTERCERFATVYAAWNDLLHWEKPVTDSAILEEVLEHWHPDKLQIPKAKWVETLGWMRHEGYIPNRFGHPTAPKPQPELFSTGSP